jgi:hypothetical protein
MGVIIGPWRVQPTLLLLPRERTSSVCRITSDRCQTQTSARMFFDKIADRAEDTTTIVQTESGFRLRNATPTRSAQTLTISIQASPASMKEIAASEVTDCFPSNIRKV